MKLQGATAVVTGASQGIGQAIAQIIAAQGAHVALVGRNLYGLQQTQANIQNAGGEAKIFVADLRNSQAINQCAIDIQSHWGTVDILANIAGAWHDDQKTYFGPFQDRSLDEIDTGLDVNLRAPLLLSHAFITGMIRKRQGKIINLSGVFPEFGNQHLVYYVSKTAIETFTTGLAVELRKHNIQVNCISPGEVNTPFIRKFFPEHANAALRPDVVAKLALFLLENEVADYITGETILIGYDGTFWDWDQVVHDLEMSSKCQR